MRQFIQRHSTLLIVIVVISCVIIFWHKSEPNPYADVPQFEPIEYNDGVECYKSYAFQNELALKYRLKTVDQMEPLLQKENKRKIIFHKTDCIHDGVLRISAR